MFHKIHKCLMLCSAVNLRRLDIHPRHARHPVVRVAARVLGELGAVQRGAGHRHDAGSGHAVQLRDRRRAVARRALHHHDDQQRSRGRMGGHHQSGPSRCVRRSYDFVVYAHRCCLTMACASCLTCISALDIDKDLLQLLIVFRAIRASTCRADRRGYVPL